MLVGPQLPRLQPGGRVLLDRLSWGELGFKVESGVDLRSGSSARWCVVRVHLLFRFRVLVWFGLPTVVELKIATYAWQEPQLVF
jgi:hypothetical protein